jgi:transposase
MNDASSETLPVEATPGQTEAGPGRDLTPKQREAAYLVVTEALSVRKVAQRVHVTPKTIQRWRQKPEWRRYVDHLLNLAVSEAERNVRAIFASASPRLAQRLVELGEGKGQRGKVKHPYQVDALKEALAQLIGRPSRATPTVEAGASVPTDHGRVEIIFRSGGAPRE